MALYNKKLHVRKAGVVTDINLYTTPEEVGNPSLKLKDNNNIIYAKLGNINDSNATEVRIRENNSIYAVLKSASTLPQTPTLLKSIDVDAYLYVSYVSITIPVGVNVIQVEHNCYDFNSYDSSSDLWNTVNKVEWSHSESSYRRDSVTYIGVTPGKTYNMGLSWVGFEAFEASASARIYYSDAINKMTPNVIDR